MALHLLHVYFKSDMDYVHLLLHKNRNLSQIGFNKRLIFIEFLNEIVGFLEIFSM